ncbi:hypothetical protein Pmani_013103 [Petrolisthes manimaculis]|uniref:Myb/SANT-like DNA-binding domain-containing protein n=1 Tax=Petrolisthes manimaculis TaxID=1843537 RepID=A0AAE1PY77_9EUCA|nr:hypothetical protein Pmani_013103 [Petrolisthes manimaculis]
MRQLKRRYKIIKDKSSLSERDAVKQWQYFTAMDDVFAGDPAVVTLVVDSSLPMGWPRQAVLLLIETFRMHMPDFDNPRIKKYQVWNEVAEEMQLNGYNHNGTACDNKMRQLKRRYKIIKDKSSLSERDAVKQWQYFTAMDDVFAGDPAVVTLVVDSSLPMEICPSSGVGSQQDAESESQQDNGWPRQAVLLLIETFRMHMPDFDNPRIKKYQVWNEVAEEMQLNGYNHNGTACDNKMRQLKRRYKIIKDKSSLSERDAVKQWQYFTAMDDVFAGDPAVVTLVVDSSLPMASPLPKHPHQRDFSPTPLPIISTNTSPSTSATQSPAPSPSIEVKSCPVSPALSSPASERKKRKQTFMETPPWREEHNKLLATLITKTDLRKSSIDGFAKNAQYLENKIEHLLTSLVEQEHRHQKQYEEMRQQHKQELMEQRQQHRQEMMEQRQQYKEELDKQHSIISKMQEQMLQMILHFNRKGN